MAAYTRGASGAQAINGLQRTAFAVGAIYDGVLGVLFLIGYRPLLEMLGVEVPANPVYLQLAAGLIALMGLMQYFAWRNARVDDESVIVLVGFKALYVLLALFSAMRGDLPHPIFGVFAALDLLFLAIYLGVLRGANRPAGR